MCAHSKNKRLIFSHLNRPKCAQMRQTSEKTPHRPTPKIEFDTFIMRNMPRSHTEAMTTKATAAVCRNV